VSHVEYAPRVIEKDGTDGLKPDRYITLTATADFLEVTPKTVPVGRGPRDNNYL